MKKIEENLLASFFFTLEESPFKELFSIQDFAWHPLHLLESFLERQKLGKIETSIPASAHLELPSLISIGENTVVEPGAYIKGPCIIGKNCVVRHGAYIRGNVLAGDGCLIGHNTEIKHSILLQDVHAAHFAYIGDSILGNGVHLGAGVKCANYRLDGQEVTIWHKGEKWATGLKKMGAIIGDHTHIGCNSVLNPGTLVGKKTLSHPLVTLQGFIPAGSIVKSLAKVGLL